MGTHYPGTDEQRRALDAYIKLLRAGETITLEMERRLRATRRLTTTQLGVLEALHHLGPLVQRDLGEKLLKSAGNVTTVVDNLVRRGLVERVRGDGDRRCVTVHLTPAGHALIEAVIDPHVAAIVDRMNVLDGDELAVLARLCRKLGLGRTGAPKPST
jgi:MarR family 2-MHQ and catechol resistance regulon transcriptional repressor